jgi:hypothetical protein
MAARGGFACAGVRIFNYALLLGAMPKRIAPYVIPSQKVFMRAQASRRLAVSVA